MRAVQLLALLILICPLYAAEDFDQQQIIQRIQPIGQVNVEEQTQTLVPNENAQKATKVVEKQAPGQAVYEKYCSVCHKDGLAGAPKFRSAEDWKPRLAKQNMDGLKASAIKGLNAMPPKGTCQECSDDDIKEAIKYMLPPP